MTTPKSVARNLLPPPLVVSVETDKLNAEINGAVPVRRPLSIPSTRNKYGKVLSHSAIVVSTDRGYVLVEYMWGSSTFVKDVPTYVEGKNFEFEDFIWIHDNDVMQKPNRRVTVQQLAERMSKFMIKHPFETFTHNCHIARFFTMQFYGMESDDPRKMQTNIFLQGIKDFFEFSKCCCEKTPKYTQALNPRLRVIEP